MSPDVSGRRQVLRFLWQAAFASANGRCPTTAAAGSGAPTRGSAGVPKGRITGFRPGRLPVLSCYGRSRLGAASCFSGGGSFSARPACAASPTAGDQAACGRTHAAGSNSLGSESGFHDAGFLAGRNLGI